MVPALGQKQDLEKSRDVVTPTSYAETLSSLDKWQILLGHISVTQGS